MMAPCPLSVLRSRVLRAGAIIAVPGGFCAERTGAMPTDREKANALVDLAVEELSKWCEALQQLNDRLGSPPKQPSAAPVARKRHLTVVQGRRAA